MCACASGKEQDSTNRWFHRYQRERCSTDLWLFVQIQNFKPQTIYSNGFCRCKEFSAPKVSRFSSRGTGAHHSYGYFKEWWSLQRSAKGFHRAWNLNAMWHSAVNQKRVWHHRRLPTRKFGRTLLLFSSLYCAMFSLHSFQNISMDIVTMGWPLIFSPEYQIIYIDHYLCRLINLNLCRK